MRSAVGRDHDHCIGFFNGNESVRSTLLIGGNRPRQNELVGGNDVPRFGPRLIFSQRETGLQYVLSARHDFRFLKGDWKRLRLTGWNLNGANLSVGNLDPIGKQTPAAGKVT